MRTGLLVVFVFVLVSAGCFGITAPEQSDPATTDSPDPTVTPSPSVSDTDGTSHDKSPTASPTEAPPQTQRPDPNTDTLGWEDGYWHDDPISVNRTDGLNDTELDVVVSRAMARVEAIRQVEFESRVPVTIITREQFRANRTDQNYSTSDRLHQNTKWEAAFVVGESTDALSVRESNRAATVLGYYSFRREAIVIVSDDTESPEMNEITLAQELYHALQDQAFEAFDQDWYPGRTTESHNAADGLVEGDGNYVDYLYEQRCDSEWDCLEPRSSPGGDGSDINIGMFAVSFQPYSDGPVFVRQIYERNGWDAVDDIYSNPPQSSEQVIHPEKYGVDEPTTPTIDHTPSNGWRVLDMGENSVDYATFGEAGLAVMMWYPSYVATSQSGAPTDVVVGLRDFYNFEPGTNELLDLGPYNYNFSVTDGWGGDRLVPYVNDDSASTNETGYVWKLTWDSTADASEFVEGYEALLSYHDAESVTEDVYRIPDDSEFSDAFSVRRSGDTVTIVNAPTVDALGDVHAGAGPED